MRPARWLLAAALVLAACKEGARVTVRNERARAVRNVELTVGTASHFLGTLEPGAEKRVEATGTGALRVEFSDEQAPGGQVDSGPLRPIHKGEHVTVRVAEDTIRAD